MFNTICDAPNFKKFQILLLNGYETNFLRGVEYLKKMRSKTKKKVEWNRNQNSQTNVYFHHLRVFQNSESNIRDFSNRPYYITQFIVEAEYHFTDSIESILA